MKQTKLLFLVTLSTASFLLSCNGNQNAATVKDSSTSPAVSAKENGQQIQQAMRAIPKR